MNYTKYAKKAYEKIKKYGSSVKIIRSGSKTYNSITNSYENSGKEINGYAVRSVFKQKNIDKTNIQFDDIFLFASLDDVPKSNDTVFFNKKSYTIVNVENFSPNGEIDIFYNIQAR